MERVHAEKKGDESNLGRIFWKVLIHWTDGTFLDRFSKTTRERVRVFKYKKFQEHLHIWLYCFWAIFYFRVWESIHRFWVFIFINQQEQPKNQQQQPKNYNEEYKRKMFPKWLLCGLTQIPPHSVNYSKGITIKLAGVEWNGISLTSNDSPFVIKANPKLLIIFCKTGAKAKCMDSSLLRIPLCANARTFASGLLLHSENIKMVFVFGFVAALRTIFNKELFPCVTVYYIYTL